MYQIYKNSSMKEIDKKLRRVRGRRAVVAAVIIAPVIALAQWAGGYFRGFQVEEVDSDSE